MVYNFYRRMSEPVSKVPRRDFIKMAWAFLGGSALLSAEKKGIVIDPPSKKGVSFNFVDSRIDEKLHNEVKESGRLEYPEESKKIIEDIRRKFDIEVISPEKCPLTEVYASEANSIFSFEELLIVKKSLSNLPPEHFEKKRPLPNRLFLFKRTTDFFDGGYAKGDVFITIPKSFDLNGVIGENGASFASEFLQTQSKVLEYIVYHEEGHKMLEESDDLTNEWISVTGWYSVSGPNGEQIWKNDKPEDILEDFGAEQNFSEDFAVSIGMYILGNHNLSTSRISFFQQNKHLQKTKMQE